MGCAVGCWRSGARRAHYGTLGVLKLKVDADEATALQGSRAKNTLFAVVGGDTAVVDWAGAVLTQKT